MHLPDGFLDPKISTGLLGAATIALSYSFARVKAALTAFVPQYAFALAGNKAKNFASGRLVLSRYAYLMGLVSAVIFLAQLFDFTLYPGVTGHILGGAFAAIILGPFGGVLAMATVLLSQAVFLGDGGLLALGANIVNLAFICSLGGYYLYAGLKKLLPDWLSIGLAAWLSVVLAAAAYGLEASLSGKAFIMPEMLKIHLIIGISEGLATIGLVGIFRKAFKSAF